jgi:hypothetical protein
LPGEPVTSEKVLAFYNNPIAIAEGASGAPKVEDAALDTGAATAAGITWVGLRNAALAAGAVGTYVLGSSSASLTFGATIAGSSIQPAGAYDDGGYKIQTGSSLSGTWRCMGRNPSLGSNKMTLYLRIS